MKQFFVCFVFLFFLGGVFANKMLFSSTISSTRSRSMRWDLKQWKLKMKLFSLHASEFVAVSFNNYSRFCFAPSMRLWCASDDLSRHLWWIFHISFKFWHIKWKGNESELCLLDYNYKEVKFPFTSQKSQSHCLNSRDFQQQRILKK